MKRILKNVGVTLATALTASAIALACAHNDSSVFISKVFSPSIPSNGQCSYTADPTQPSEAVGQADVSFANLSTYSPVVLIGNQILTQASMTAEQTETSVVIINGAITRITDLAGNTSLESTFATLCDHGNGDQAACSVGKKIQSGALAAPINPFHTYETTSIEPGTGTTPSYAAMGLTMVDGATIALVRDYFVTSLVMNGGAATFGTTIQLVTYTKVEGVTLGGDAVESNEFLFPVTLSYGALVDNLATDPTSAYGYCVDLNGITIPTTAQTCVSGQDQGVLVTSLEPLSLCPSASDATVTTPTGDAGSE